MSRQNLEKYQVLLYLAAILAGLLAGVSYPGLKAVLEPLLWPVLGLLLYATFTQVSLTNIPGAFRDRRFIGTALAGNFLIIPLIVLGFITLLPGHDAIRLGVALVLLVPCTDWFITFTRLGLGDTERAIAFSPLSLLFQILLLPVWLFLFFGDELTVTLATSEMVLAFFGIIVAPLVLAGITEKWVDAAPAWRSVLISGLGWMPVPLLAAVIFMIAASQAQVLFHASGLLVYPVICFVIFLVAAPVLAKVLAKVASLLVHQGRTLAFSFGSRNSFVVLPLALALPEAFEIAVFVIVLQSLIELFGMAVYVWLIPNVLFRHQGKGGKHAN